MARILVVDDQETILKMLESLLTPQGHAVTTAKDAFDALEKIKAQAFDLVITDAIMPGGPSGFDLVKTIRAEPSMQKMLVILLTGRREKKDVQQGIESGVDDYCVKPVDPDLFVAKVNALLKKKLGSSGASFPECPTMEDVEFKTTVRVVGVSEIGLSFQSNQPFNPGTKITLGEEFFDKIGIDGPNLRVMTCDLQGKMFLVRVQYIGLSEQSLQPLRMWIRSRTLSKAG